MAWYDEAVFYHMYPLGLTGAPKQNDYGKVEHRLQKIFPWIDHLKNIGVTGLYIGPLFESVGHGYETTDYKKLDTRLGDNADLKEFVARCHKAGIKVILDGVFNHTGRDFFAFKDIKQNREGSRYRDWYCNVNFYGNNEYNDGFSYDNWGGYNLLVKLNQRNPEVKDYICNVIRFWVTEFDIDGIRLDAADVLDFDFMKALRATANDVKPDFWLMGEVIHGDYSRWVNEGTLHSVTNYVLHKGLYSGMNDHNFFEIAHTVKRLNGMIGNNFKLYNFVDNHDVERIYTKLNNKAHYVPVHILLYTLPGIPSIYYGSEFGIEGKKEKFSDDSLRPELNYEDYKNAYKDNSFTKFIAALGKARKDNPELSYGDFREHTLTNRQYAFTRNLNGKSVVVTVNNDDNQAGFTVPCEGCDKFVGVLSGQTVSANNGCISVTIPGNSGDIWVPATRQTEVPKESVNAINDELKKKAEAEEKAKAEARAKAESAAKAKAEAEAKAKAESEAKAKAEAKADADLAKKATDTKEDKVESEVKKVVVPANKSYEEMTVEELQAAILEKMAKNGPVTDQMKKTVYDNIWHDSLVNWVKSFR